MRSTAQGSFAAMLLLIPILAVPMLAIFGVPDFTPVVESPLGNPNDATGPTGSDAPPFAQAVQVPETEFAPMPPASPANVAAWPAAQSDPRSDQEQLARLQAVRHAGFQTPAAEQRPIVTASTAAPSVASPFSPAEERSEAQSFPNPVALASIQSQPTRVTAPPAAMNPGFTAPAPTANGAPLTWRAAVQRLNQMEIRNFRLEPGRTPEQFVFICSYTPRDNPRVSYRFEAEADEPLKAVEKVLAQIDSWLATR